MRSIFVEKPDPLELRLQTSGLGQITVWLPVLIALGVIATESTSTFSSAQTSRWLRPFFESLFGRMDEPAWAVLHHLLRKCGHFVGYGLVCLTFLRAWLLELGGMIGLTRDAWRQRAALLAVLSTLLVASLDEWHQTSLPSRTGSAWDALLDTCGALLTCCLTWLFFWRRRTGRPLRPAARV